MSSALWYCLYNLLCRRTLRALRCVYSCSLTLRCPIHPLATRKELLAAVCVFFSQVSRWNRKLSLKYFFNFASLLATQRSVADENHTDSRTTFSANIHIHEFKESLKETALTAGCSFDRRRMGAASDLQPSIAALGESKKNTSADCQRIFPPCTFHIT